MKHTPIVLLFLSAAFGYVFPQASQRLNEHRIVRRRVTRMLDP